MGRRRRLITHLYVPYIIIMVLSLLAVSVIASSSIKRHYIKQTTHDLEIKARLAQKIVGKVFLEPDRPDAEEICIDAAGVAEARITAVSTAGKVLCDSDADPQSMENHANRPEIRSAMAGRLGVNSHWSNSLSQDMLYVAAPVFTNDRIVGAVRIATPITDVSQALHFVYLRIVLGGVAAAIIAAIIIFLAVRKISRSVDDLKTGAERYARGDFEYRLGVQGAEEIGLLAETLNRMAWQLMRLENVRKDFVSNVSHELMTPITNIKGFVETLKDGAASDPKRMAEFLDIIDKHTNRIKAIVEDLLNLSRLEQDAGAEKVRLEEEDLKKVLESAVSLCRPRAEDIGIDLKIECDADIKILINPILLEGALVNLIDNAVKHSKKGSAVHIKARRLENEVEIKVVDFGCGIAPEHLTRIFERFYRVDKSRSRELGGTGLGLAIVKHVIDAHGGRILVESSPGKGSEFTVFLPIR